MMFYIAYFSIVTANLTEKCKENKLYAVLYHTQMYRFRFGSLNAINLRNKI